MVVSPDIWIVYIDNTPCLQEGVYCKLISKGSLFQSIAYSEEKSYCLFPSHTLAALLCVYDPDNNGCIQQGVKQHVKAFHCNGEFYIF